MASEAIWKLWSDVQNRTDRNHHLPCRGEGCQVNEVSREVTFGLI